jgi:hypothetical protein
MGIIRKQAKLAPYSLLDVEGIHAGDELGYPTALPEGRFLSRGVRVIVVY